jgi:hypothetical protein
MSEKKDIKIDHDFPGQQAGENVELVFRQHPLVMRKELFIGLGLIVLGVLPLDFPQIYANPAFSSFCLKVALITPLFVFVLWFWRWIGWYYSVYIVTDRRILEIKQKGLFNRAVNDWAHNQVSNMSYHIPGLQAVMFSYGTITVRTWTGDLVMNSIYKPTKIYAQLTEIVREGGGAQATGQASTPADV